MCLYVGLGFYYAFGPCRQPIIAGVVFLDILYSRGFGVGYEREFLVFFGKKATA